jgi:hypothetical protein
MAGRPADGIADMDWVVVPTCITGSPLPRCGAVAAAGSRTVELGQLPLDVDGDRAEEVDLWAGEMWARTSSSTLRP